MPQTPGTWLQRLVACASSDMRAHIWKPASPVIDLNRTIRKYDKRTRGDGFHALHDWDGIADKVNPETIPVDVLDYLVRERGQAPVEPVVLGILLDYYYMHLLALVALRIWDEGDADRNLDRVDGLLAALQGPNGSSQRFADDAETLILIATSHFELAEWGYAKLLDLQPGGSAASIASAWRWATPRASAATCGLVSRPPTAATP